MNKGLVLNAGDPQSRMGSKLECTVLRRLIFNLTIDPIHHDNRNNIGLQVCTTIHVRVSVVIGVDLL